MNGSFAALRQLRPSKLEKGAVAKSTQKLKVSVRRLGLHEVKRRFSAPLRTSQRLLCHMDKKSREAPGVPMKCLGCGACRMGHGAESQKGTGNLTNASDKILKTAARRTLED